MQKNKSIIVVIIFISILAMARNLLLQEPNSSSLMDDKTKTKSQPQNKINAASTNTKETRQITPKLDIACANLPSEIDPGDSELMQLYFKCHEKIYVKLPPFNMPDTSWPERKIKFKGKIITYKFGEGNPYEVALKPEDYNGSKGVYEDYVTPEAEKNLYEFLSNPLLKKVIDKCESTMGRDAVDLSVPLIRNFGAVLDDKEISMEKMLKIDKETGRKYIDNDRVIALSGSLYRLDDSLAGGQSKKLKYQCLNFYDLPDFENLHQQYSKFEISYTNGPIGYYGDDPKNPDFSIDVYIHIKLLKTLDTLRILDIWAILGNLWK